MQDSEERRGRTAGGDASSTAGASGSETLRKYASAVSATTRSRMLPAAQKVVAAGKPIALRYLRTGATAVVAFAKQYGESTVLRYGREVVSRGKAQFVAMSAKARVAWGASALVAVAMAVLALALPSQQPVSGSALLAMTASERAARLSDGAEAAAQRAQAEGDARRAACIRKWFSQEGGFARVEYVAGVFKDRDVQSMIEALLARACGQ